MSSSINLGKRRALIVAISEYDKLDNLPFCKNDGEAISNVLILQNYMLDEGSKLIGKVDGRVLRDRIINFFTEPTISPNDTLFFYYSGHGVPDSENDVYLSTSEIEPDYPYRRGFSFYELTKMMRKSVSKKIIAILDCCYSGAAGLTKGGESDAAKLGNAAINSSSNSLVEGEGVCLLASSQANQEAFALREENHSVFTYYLIRGLSGEEGAIDDYGYVTADSLGKFIYNKIMSLPLEKRPKQRPLRKMETSGEIVVAYYPQYSKRKEKSPEIFPMEDIGKQYIDKKDYKSALEYYERVMQDPTKAELWINKGIIHHKLKNDSEAVKCLDVALVLDPMNALALCYKGMALANLGKYEESISCSQKSIDLDPKNENSWFAKGMSLFYLSKYDEALVCMDRSIQINSKAELAICGKGEILRLRGENNEAIKCYEKAIEISPTLPVPWTFKAALCAAIGRNEEALQCYDRAIEYFENYSTMKPGLHALWNSKGNILGDLGKRVESLECYNKAIEYDPQYAIGWLNKAFTLMTMKKFKESIECAQHAIDLAPNDKAVKTNGVNVIKLVGMYLLVLDKYKEAIDCFEKLLKIDSNDDSLPNILKVIHENPYQAKKIAIENMPQLDSNYSWVDSINQTSGSGTPKRKIYTPNGKLVEY